MKNIPIGEVLKEYGYITEDQLQEALRAQEKDRSKRLGEHLLDLGFVSESQVLTALSDKLNEPLIDLSVAHISVDAVRLIPQALAEKYHMIAIDEDHGRLQVVTSDPLNFYALEDVRLVTGKNLVIALALRAQVTQMIDYYYTEIRAQNVAQSVNLGAEAIALEESALFDAQEDDTPVVKLLNSLLMRGYNSGASDIHIEPFEEETKIRMRLDGQIMDYMTLDKKLHASLIVRIKIVSNLDIAEKRIPQDGHFVMRLKDIDMNLRVSLIPTVYGEKAVLRYLNSNTPISHAAHFGMREDNYRKMCQMMEMPHGIIYVTGPTGSGKTTTLYMILEALARKQVNISTIEDPVERNLARINQMQVNNVAGLSFERGLRALLRQDPDIIMVGETRDGETASISVRAAITGHLVVSTLHTNDAASAIVRLEDMGVEPYMVANSLIGVVAQRLVRKICPHCRREVPTTPIEREILGNTITCIYRGTGCHLCGNTGYKGREAIHEIIMIDKEVRRMISKQEQIDVIYDYIKQSQQVDTLKDAAIQLVKDGITTWEELNRIIAYAD